MPTKHCPQCGARIQSARMNTDIVHECDTGDPVLDEEDVLVLGSWEDYTGSGTIVGNVLYSRGLGDELLGTNAHVDGARDEQRTDRGRRAGLYRQRQRSSYFEFDNR